MQSLSLSLSLSSLSFSLSIIGWHVGSPACRRPRMAPASCRASPKIRPQNTADPCPAAARGCSRVRGAPRWPLAARLTPLPGCLRPGIGEFSIPPLEARVQAKGARRQPGGLAWIAAGAAGSTRGVGHFHPPGRPASVLGRAPPVMMKAHPRV